MVEVSAFDVDSSNTLPNDKPPERYFPKHANIENGD